MSMIPEWRLRYRPKPMKKNNQPRPTILEGMEVHYHPAIGGPHDGKVYTVKFIDTLSGGQLVAWLSGKTGCVAIQALSLAIEEANKP